MNENQQQPDKAQSQSLTNWKNEPSVLTLKTDLEQARQTHQQQLTKINHWNDLMAVRGKVKPPKVKGRSSVQPKLIRRQAEWRYAPLSEPFLGSSKLFDVQPTTFEDAKAAEQNALILNWQFRTKLNRVKFIDDYVRSTVDEGTCIVRLGWKRVTVDVKEEVPVWTYVELIDEAGLQKFQEALELKIANPREFNENVDEALKEAVAFYEETGQVTVAEQTGTEEVTVKKVLENRPTVEVKNPANVIIDPTCGGDLDKALFVIESFETTQADLKKEDGKYKNLDKVNWEGNTPATNPEHETTTPQDFNINDKLRKKVVAYEYWGYYDIHDTGELVPIVATWIGDTLIRMEENPFPDGKPPYVVVPYLPVKRELYGEPDAELLEDNQSILGAVTRGMIDLLGRSANGQQGFAKGMLDPLNRRRYENGQDYEFNPNLTPSAGLIEHKYPELPQSALLMLNLQNQEAEALTGVKSFAGGMSGDAYGDVASGIRGILDAASKREMAILRRLAMGMTQIGYKIISMNAVFLSAEEVVRVTNKDFVTIQREDLQGNFDLIVDISTAEVDNAKANDLSFVLQTMGNTLDIGLTIYILAEIAKLKRMPELAEKISSFQPQPDPIAKAKAELEVEELRLKVLLLQSEIDVNNAKAEELRSRTDLNDLDFVETETGTKHARDQENIRAQARSNQDLEVTKALTKSLKEGEKRPDIETAVGFNELSDQLNSLETQPMVDNSPQNLEMA